MSDFRSVISLHSNPRSGSSWVGQIFDSSPEVRYKYQPLKSYSFLGRLSENSSKEEVRKFFNDLYHCHDDYLDQLSQKAAGIAPLFKEKMKKPGALVIKHVRYHYLVPFFLEHFPEVKLVGIVRHPCGYLNSWRKAPKEFLPEWNFEEEWYFGQSYNRFRSGEYYGFNRWKEVSMLFLEMKRQFSGSFKMLRYEDLVKNPESEVRGLFDFVGLEFGKQTQQFVHDSTSRKVEDDYSVFRGNKDIRTWENELPSSVIDRVYLELEHTPLGMFLKK